MKRKKTNKEETRYSEEAASLLPAPVSSIKVQKKNKSRFSIFVEDRFLVGISDSVLTKLKIAKGVEITPFLLQEIVEAENKWAAKEYMLRILGRRDHSKKELKTKAAKKGFSGDFLDDLVEELESKGYVEDSKFALKYAGDKFEFNDWGPFKVRTELMKKGISRDVIEQTLDEVFTEEKVKSTLFYLVDKKKRRFQREPGEKRRKKVFDFLIRKGYDSSDVLSHIDKLLELIEK